MALELMQEMPFSLLSDFEICNMYSDTNWDFLENDTFVDYIKNYLKGNFHGSHPFDFKYFTETEFNHKFRNIENNDTFSVFHLNIRSLNSNCSSLCQFLALLELKFDVIVLTEICAFNITFYHNVLSGYHFYYKLPVDSKVGGVGLYIRNCYNVQEVPQLNIVSSDSNKVENMWLEVSDRDNKVVVGSIYRHPNQNFNEFKTKLEACLDKISNQSIPCIITGDMNIDLVKSTNHSATSQFVDSLFIYNFMPTILMPTRITRSSATLIDHIYYYEGDQRNIVTVKSGNLLTDITDHLPNFIILTKHSKVRSKIRPKIRIFSEKKHVKFQTFIRKYYMGQCLHSQ